MMQLLWKNLVVPQKFKQKVLYDSEIPLLGTYLKHENLSPHMQVNVHNSVILQ
jgi:hypothetical protein